MLSRGGRSKQEQQEENKRDEISRAMTTNFVAGGEGETIWRWWRHNNKQEDHEPDPAGRGGGRQHDQ